MEAAIGVGRLRRIASGMICARKGWARQERLSLRRRRQPCTNDTRRISHGLPLALELPARRRTMEGRAAILPCRVRDPAEHDLGMDDIERIVVCAWFIPVIFGVVERANPPK